MVMGWFRNALDNLKTRAEKRSTGLHPAACAGDPVAQKTEWGPLTSFMTSNITMHKLVPDIGYGLAYKPTWGMKLFFGMFVRIGLACMGFGTQQGMTDDDPQWWILPIIGLVFSATGFGFYKNMAKTVMFSYADSAFISRGTQTPFNDIHALQLLSYTSEYRVYQINLVLKDGNRVHVVNHAAQENAEADAEKIAEFLGNKVIWNTIS